MDRHVAGPADRRGLYLATFRALGRHGMRGVNLLFDQKRLPRSMKRAEWREIDRWRRMTQRKLREVAESRAASIRHASEDLGAFGSIMLLIEAEKLINPSVVIGPYQ